MSSLKPNRKIFPSQSIHTMNACARVNFGMKLVLTNGVFDLLHPGHIYNLMTSATFGDKLVVVVNGQDSARSLKGEGRPFICEKDRLEMVASLEFVDFVMPWNSEDGTIIEVMKIIKPEVWTKGQDRTLETLNQDERKIVESYGGTIELIPIKEGFSTTSLINKIKQHEG